MAAAETNRVGKSENCLPEQMLRRQQQTAIKQNMAEKQRSCGRNDEELVSLEAVQMLPAFNELAGLWNNCRICLTRESELRGFPLCSAAHPIGNRVIWHRRRSLRTTKTLEGLKKNIVRRNYTASQYWPKFGQRKKHRITFRGNGSAVHLQTQQYSFPVPLQCVEVKELLLNVFQIPLQCRVQF